MHGSPKISFPKPQTLQLKTLNLNCKAGSLSPESVNPKPNARDSASPSAENGAPKQEKVRIMCLPKPKTLNCPKP